MTTAAAGRAPDLSSALCLADVAVAARASVPSPVWDFVEGGSGAELSLAANREALDALYLVPQVLRDVSEVSMACRMLGTPGGMPVAVAPMAYQRLLHAEGELAVARAAAAAGIPFTVPLLSSVAMERVAAAGARMWFQAYWLRDRGLLMELICRAEAVGCRALVFTVDVPRMGRRLRDMRSGFALPDHVSAAHLTVDGASAAQRGTDGVSAVAAHTKEIFDQSLSWNDLEWLRERTTLPLVLKGVLAPEDAVRAARAGVQALIVSNHGGRQLDGAPPGIEMLPRVREAVEGECELLVDGGIRSGTDVLRALALGASGVLLGRPVLHGLAAGGEQGVTRVLTLLREELDDAMALSGCGTTAEASSLTLAQVGRRRATSLAAL